MAGGQPRALPLERVGSWQRRGGTGGGGAGRMDIGVASIISTLQRYWGYSEFRNHQEEVVRHLISGEDVLVLMATGSGKSLCYQLPAAWAYSQPPGAWAGGRVTIVVSPLVSLMEDQVAGLDSTGIKAVMLGGSNGATGHGRAGGADAEPRPLTPLDTHTAAAAAAAATSQATPRGHQPSPCRPSAPTQPRIPRNTHPALRTNLTHPPPPLPPPNHHHSR